MQTTKYIKILSLIALCFLLTYPNRLNSANSIDSLKAVLNFVDDEAKVSALLEIAQQYRDNSNKLQLKYAKKAYNLAQKISYEKGKADALIKIGISQSMNSNNFQAIKDFNSALIIYEDIKDLKGQTIAFNALGRAYSFLGSFKVAEEYYKKSIIIKKRLNDKFQIGVGYLNLGEIYEKKENLSDALEYCLKSLNIFKEVNDTTFISKSLNNIANVYYRLELFDKSLEYYHKSLEIMKKQNNIIDLPATLNNIANVYVEQGNYDKAIDYYFEALDIADQLDNVYRKCNTYLNIGNVYKEIKNYSKSEFYYQESLKLSKEIQDKHGTADANRKLGELFCEMKLYDKGIDYFQKGISFYEAENIKESSLNLYLLISEAYKKKEDYLSALEFQEQYSTRLSEVLTMDNSNLIKNITQKVMAEKEIEILNKEKIIQEAEIFSMRLITCFLVFLFILSTALPIISFRVRKYLKQKNNIINKKSDLLLKVDNALEYELSSYLFPVANHISKLEKNEENVKVINSYNLFVKRYNRLVREVVQNN